MSRSKRDILDAERMLERLTALLVKHHPDWRPVESPVYFHTVRPDAEALRRISMTLHRWHELECGDGNEHATWTITRGHKSKDKLAPRGYVFNHDENGAPYVETHHHKCTGNHVTYSPIPDREKGARKRLGAILARYLGLQAYIQTDPRGCALYILRLGDVLEGSTADSCYARGLAVFK